MFSSWVRASRAADRKRRFLWGRLGGGRGGTPVSTANACTKAIVSSFGHFFLDDSTRGNRNKNKTAAINPARLLQVLLILELQNCESDQSSSTCVTSEQGSRPLPSKRPSEVQLLVRGKGNSVLERKDYFSSSKKRVKARRSLSFHYYRVFFQCIFSFVYSLYLLSPP